MSVPSAARGYVLRMSRLVPTGVDLRRLWAELEVVLSRGADEAKAWLATPTGRQVRSLASKLLIVSLPLALRHPFFKTPLGRVIEVTGGAALVVKVAELIRDWDPDVGDAT